MRLAFSTCQAKIFGGRNFRDLAFDRENFYLAKISRYMVPPYSAYAAVVLANEQHSVSYVQISIECFTMS